MNAPERISAIGVYAAINAVQAALAVTGITKSRQNQQQRYNFRGIDDVYNVVSPLLAKHGLCILPRVLSHHCVERQTKNGSPLFYTTLDVEFDFVCAADGSSHTVRTVGEAMDSADKSSNKAMSAAYKYAVMQAFAIPTEGDNDADGTTHDVAAGPHPLLITLRQAAMEGPTALRDAFNEHKDDPALADIWKRHSAALKSAAEQAGEVQ